MRAAGRKANPPQTDGVITTLKVRNGRPDRTAVYLDGSFAFDLATRLVDDAGLRTGDPLSVEAQDRLATLDAPYRARSRALRLLTLRERSRHEVQIALQRAGFDAEVIADALAWLESLDYLDDARFAVSYLEDRLRAGWGVRRVRAELRRKGVDSALIERALQAEGENPQVGVEGAEAILRMARRRFATQFAVDAQAVERRLAGFLLRRGYDWDDVGRVARILRLEAGASAGGLPESASSIEEGGMEP